MGANYLKTLPYVDADRIGIWGLSYGGFFTLIAMTDQPTLFRAGVMSRESWTSRCITPIPTTAIGPRAESAPPNKTRKSMPNFADFPHRPARTASARAPRHRRRTRSLPGIRPADR